MNIGTDMVNFVTANFYDILTEVTITTYDNVQ